MIPLIVVVFSVYFLVGCETVPEEIPEDLSKAQMFQQAQENVDQGDYENALRYYEEFIRRNPADTGGITEAEYEIAFIAYKREEYDLAERRFTELLDKYENVPDGSLPDWPRILSRRLLEIIEERQAEELLAIPDGASGESPADGGNAPLSE